MIKRLMFFYVCFLVSFCFGDAFLDHDSGIAIRTDTAVYVFDHLSDGDPFIDLEGVFDESGENVADLNFRFGGGVITTLNKSVSRKGFSFSQIVVKVNKVSPQTASEVE